MMPGGGSDGVTASTMFADSSRTHSPLLLLLGKEFQKMVAVGCGKRQRLADR
jgi:hypothetical protein